MELREALDKASQILDEERVSPTVSYDYTPQANEDGEFSAGKVAIQALTAIAGTVSISNMRQQRPREIQSPTAYKFKSTNYGLLCSLLSRLPENSRRAYLGGVSLRLVSVPGCVQKPLAFFPAWNNLSSELPLVAEFLVRNHGKANLIRALFEAEHIPGHATLLRQMEEMIALNYTVFTDSDYETLASAMLSVAARAEARKRSTRRSMQFPCIGRVSVL